MIDSGLLKYNYQDRKFIVFDYEGDLNTLFPTPFQLGFTILHGNKIVEEHDYYIKWPDLKISKFVQNYAHFNPHRMEVEGKDPKEVFDIFSKYIYNPEYLLVGANVLSFDCSLTYSCLKKLGMRHNYEFLNRVYDTNSLFKGYKLSIKPDNDNLLAYQYSMNSIIQKGLKSSVSYVAKEFDIEFDENRMHDGAYDCQIIGQNFFELIKKIDVK